MFICSEHEYESFKTKDFTNLQHIISYHKLNKAKDSHYYYKLSKMKVLEVVDDIYTKDMYSQSTLISNFRENNDYIKWIIFLYLNFSFIKNK